MTENGWQLNAQRLFIATNGFTRRLLPTLEIQPARNQVLITKPIKNLRFKGTFHLNKGYYYFRNFENRVLFGGGRHLDKAGETTEQFGTTDLIQNSLKTILKENILPDQQFEIEQWWSGILGVGKQKTPIVEQYSENITIAVRLSGIGVAISSLVADEGVELCLG
jgi:glycine/D-amino acid oxidase-like deaminating enzyme